MPPSDATVADNVVALPASRVRKAMGRLGGIFAPDGYEHEFLPAAVEVLEIRHAAAVAGRAWR